MTEHDVTVDIAACHVRSPLSCDPLPGGTAHSRKTSVALQPPGSSRPYVTVSRDLGHHLWPWPASRCRLPAAGLYEDPGGSGVLAGRRAPSDSCPESHRHPWREPGPQGLAKPVGAIAGHPERSIWPVPATPFHKPAAEQLDDMHRLAGRRG